MDELKAKFDFYKKEMDKFQRLVGMPDLKHNSSEIESIINIDSNTLKTKTKVEISQYGFMLSQYSLFLQNEINKCDSFMKWAKYNTASFFGSDKSQLIKWMQNTEMKSDRIKYLSKKIEVMSQQLSSLSKAMS